LDDQKDIWLWPVEDCDYPQMSCLVMPVPTWSNARKEHKLNKAEYLSYLSYLLMLC